MKLSALCDRVDAALADGRVEGRHGQVRALVDLRRRMSGQLADWYDKLGMTPNARATWAGKLRASEELRRRLGELDG